MKQRRNDGFTLIELAIVTAIIGLLAAGAVASFGALRTNTKIKETYRNLASAELLLQTFVARNGRLPCPSDPRLAPDDEDYAKEASADPDDPGAGCAGSQQTGSRYWGALPAYSLGATPGDLADGWNNQIFYFVVGSAAISESVTNGIWAVDNDDDDKEYELWDKADDAASLTRNKIVNRGVLALISAGPNGNGAYTLSGAQLGISPVTAIAENDNQDADNSLVTTTYSEDSATPFDDIVRVLTEDDILRPLAEMGEVQTKRALTLERMKRLADVIYMTILDDDPDFATPADLSDLPDDSTAGLTADAWGNDFVYAQVGDVCSSSGAFTLGSLGGSVPDISATFSAAEILKLMSAANLTCPP